MAQGIGLRSISKEFGLDYRITVYSDAYAALGIARRRGLGRVRHLDVEDLWVQEKIRNGEVQLEKVPGSENMADALTKQLARPLLVKHMSAMNLQPEQGRAESAPKLTV